MSIEFTLPWPPTVNTYWRRVGNRTVLSRRGREYRQDATGALMRSCKAPLEGRLSVEILCYPPDNRKRDLDNLPKAVLDACTHAGVWLDDSQIDHLEITRCDTRRPGHVLVSVKTIDDLVCFTLVL